MEMVKKEPSTFDLKGNNSSQPIDKMAMGASFEGIQIEQRQTGKGDLNTMKGVPGGEQ
jgi:hypothetical protein